MAERECSATRLARTGASIQCDLRDTYESTRRALVQLRGIVDCIMATASKNRDIGISDAAWAAHDIAYDAVERLDAQYPLFVAGDEALS